jgi:hypothetical protein
MAASMTYCGVFAILSSVALAGTVTLHVGVHRQAGDVYDVAADGADGQCSVGPARLSCPASRPVTFRFGAPGEWELYGDVVLEPGSTGTAFVLATESAREAARAQLSFAVTPDKVRALFVRTGENEPPPPSPGMMADLERLARHPNPLVRRTVIDGLVPYWRRTSSDPMSLEAPELLSSGLIERLSTDGDTRVRRRLAAALRDVNAPGRPLADEANAALLTLLGDGRAGVQRAAMASMAIGTQNGILPAEMTWWKAMRRVESEGPAGRAAANTLGFLSRSLEASPTIDPSEAVLVVFHFHRERTWKVWNAWREEVPFRRDWVDSLLRDTLGLEGSLLRYWAEHEPDALAQALRAWEEDPPHSKRFSLVVELLVSQTHPAIREALELPPIPADNSE